MTRREALKSVEVTATTNLSTALELLPEGNDQEAHGRHAREVVAKVKVPEAYAQAFKAHEQRLHALPNTRTWNLECTGRFVVGLGDASVRETGLRLLRPWGLPFIPGSALKGVAAKAAHARGGEWAAPAKPGERAGAHHQALFGDVDARGKVVFHDAWWIGGSKLPLAPDVMTCHHPDYYAGKAPPLDSDSPNPVSFLSAHGRYLLALTGPGPWVELALELLREAVDLDGLGAKTAAGYGRFELGSERLSAQERRRKEVRQNLQDLPARDTGAGTHGATAAELLGARPILGDDETLDFARKVLGARPKSWQAWLAKDERTEEERWLARALGASIRAPEATASPASNATTASKATTAETWALGTARRVLTKGRKAKPHLSFEGHLEADPAQPVKDKRPLKDIKGAHVLGDEPTRVRARLKRRGKKWQVVKLQRV